MKFNSPAQQDAYEDALKSPYKAVFFDIDGTLTPFSRFLIPQSLIDTLVKIPKDVQLIVCSGRLLQYMQGKLDHIFNCSDDPEAERKRWHVIANNGSESYVYNAEKDQYDLIRRVPWPDHLVTKDALEAFIKDKLGWSVNIQIREYTLVALFHKWLYLFPSLVSLFADRMGRRMNTLLEHMGLTGKIRAVNSGLGILLVPEESGKGHAVHHMVEHLGLKKSEVLCVGDRPQPGGNDEDMLNGDCGIGFTVGHTTPNKYPLPVLNENHVRLKGPEGTEYLIKQLFQLP